MENDVDPLTGAPAIISDANVAVDELEARPLRRAQRRPNFVEVAPVPGREVVEPDDVLSHSSSVSSRLDPIKPATSVTRQLRGAVRSIDCSASKDVAVTMLHWPHAKLVRCGESEWRKDSS